MKKEKKNIFVAVNEEMGNLGGLGFPELKEPLRC